jgi:predicted TPR repeat methyltransferase
MEYTGERLIPGKAGLELLELEHRARYELASRIAEGRRVLDLGCGAGYGAARLATVARAVVAVDLAEEAIESARGSYARENLTFEAMDVADEGAEESLRTHSRSTSTSSLTTTRLTLISASSVGCNETRDFTSTSFQRRLPG